MKSGEDWDAQTESAAEEAIGYRFQDKTLLKTCFTHKSWANVCGGDDNERLEFLGDAVLSLCVTEALFAGVKDDEGALTELRQHYVSKAALEEAEARAGLMRFLRYSGGENNVRGKTPSNLFEAVVAGVYLDGGKAQVTRFLNAYLIGTETENYKSRLQELVQEREHRIPVYAVERGGQGYECTVRALGKEARGAGESKKSAETAAAKKLYEILTERTGV